VRRDATALFGLILFSLLAVLAILAPVLSPFAPSDINYDALLEPPGRMHWLGTDDLGRDMLSRILWGGRESLRVGFLGIMVGLAGGVAAGVIAGYVGGWVDAALMRGVDVLLAVPDILLVLGVVAILGPSLTTLIVALGITSIPGYARLVRGSVQAVREVEYVVAAQVIGASRWRIMVRHILPNIAGVLIVYSTVGLGSAIWVSTGLSFLGLGAQPPSPEWGAMLNAGTPFLRDAWWMAGVPGLAIFLAVLSINLLGDGLRDALDLHRQW
jgi:peptide/nickel transport system permease protein